MNRTPAALASSLLPPRGRQDLNKPLDAGASFRDLIKDSAEIRGPRRTPAGLPRIGASPHETGAESTEKRRGAEDADGSPIRPGGSGHGDIHSQCTMIQPAPLPGQPVAVTPSDILAAVNANAASFSAGDRTSFGATHMETGSRPQWAESPAQSAHENLAVARLAAPGVSSIDVQSPQFCAGPQIGESPLPPSSEPQANGGLGCGGTADPEVSEGRPAQRDSAPEEEERGQLVTAPLVKSQPDTPKPLALQSWDTSAPAAAGVNPDDAETSVPGAPDPSAKAAAEKRHQISPACQQGVRETLARPGPQEPSSVSPLGAISFAADTFGPAGYAQSALKLVETVITGSDVSARAPLPAGATIGFQPGQASSVKVKLHPAELGEVQVTMRFNKERMFIDVKVANAEAYDALTRDSGEISAKLAGLGLQIHQLTIHNSQSGSGNAPSQDQGHSFESREAPKDQRNRSDEQNAGSERGRRNINSPASPRSNELHNERSSIYI
jgi:Flagellar hook-length control protein FliK